MVFESVVTDLLNRILGDYVENLDSKQLKIGIWGGDVVLTDLVLKHSALDDLNLPVQTKYGSLGKLVLKIPWKNLYKAPCECLIDSLFLVVVPNSDVSYNAEKEEKWATEAKQAELQRIEEAKKKAEIEDTIKADDSFMEKLSTQIIKNVEIKIKNIHIRYEDKVTNPKHPFCMGVTLSNLSLITTDQDWKPAVIQDMVTKIFKVVELEGLAVYWNSDSVLYSNLPTDMLITKLQDGIATKAMIPENYLYMLGPINSTARLRLNPKPEMDVDKFSIPKLQLNFEMEKLAIGITKCQYRDVMLTVESMDRMSLASLYRKYRPNVPSYKGYAKQWWKFAYTCVLEEDIKRRRSNWDWNHMCEHRNTCNEYAELYQQKLLQKKLSPDVIERIARCEKLLDVVNIVIIRQKIAFEIERIGRKEEEQKKKSSWLMSWWSGSAAANEETADASNIMKQFQEAMTPDEKKRLFAAIDYQENSAPTEYPSDFVATTCKFNLFALQIEIRDDSLAVPRVLSVELKDVNCHVDNRPAASAIKVAVNIERFTVFGLKQDDCLPEMVSSNSSDDGMHLLEVLFETNPLDKTCNQRLHVTARPVQVIYDAETVLKLVDIFKTPPEIVSAFSQISAAAENQLATFKEFSAVGLQYVVTQHSILDLKVSLHAPYIVVPYKGRYAGSEDVLVINLGNLSISTTPRASGTLTVRDMHNAGLDEQTIRRNMIEQSYDKFVLQFTDLQIVMALKSEDWKACILGSDVTPLHILRPVNILTEIHKCVITDDPRLPKIKITGQLDALELCTTDARILLLLSLFYSIPLPEPDAAPIQPLKRDGIGRGSTLSIVSGKRIEIPDIKKKTKEIGEASQSSEDIVQFTNLEMKFELRKLSVILQHQASLTERAVPIISLEINSAVYAMIQQTYNLCVDISLESINLGQQVGENFIYMIRTPQISNNEAEKFITVKYVQVDRKAPNFRTTHKYCEKLLQLDFTMLNVILNQEGLKNTLFYMNNFTAKYEKIKPTDRIASAGGVSVKASVRQEFNLDKLKGGKKSKAKDFEMKIVHFKLRGNVQRVTVQLENEFRPLALMTLQGLNSEVIMTSHCTHIIAALNNIAVLDLNPVSLHRKILTQSSDEAMNVQVFMYNLDETSDQNEVDMRIRLSVGGLHIVFLNWFVTSLLEFMNKFQVAQEVIIEASQAAAQSAKENFQKAYAKASRIDLNIDIKAPDILMPLNSRSTEALLLDLGHITLTNHFREISVKNDLDHPAALDEMKMKLKELKLSTVKMENDDDHKIISECVILEPVTFALSITRNLSKGWYRSVPDLDMSGQIDSFNISLSQNDYSLILKILEENFKEADQVERTAVAPLSSTTSTVAEVESSKRELSTMVEEDEHEITLEHDASLILAKVENELQADTIKDNQVSIMLMFTFTMNNMIINLFYSKPNVNLPQHSPDFGLARFSLDILSVKGRILSDNTITTSLLLVNCSLDDTRIGRDGMLTRYLHRKVPRTSVGDTSVIASSTSQAGDRAFKSMLDVTFLQRGGDTFVDCRISGFQLILAMDYLMKISEFFTSGLASADNKADHIVASKSTTSTSSQATMKSRKSQTVVAKPAEKKSTTASMTLSLKIEKPDIILVEHMDTIDTNALILNSEIMLRLRTKGTHQVIKGTIADLQLFICVYNPDKRADTMSSVLHPLSIEVQGSTPPGHGLHLEIYVSDIHIGVSPRTIELLNNIYSTMGVSAKEGQSVVVAESAYNKIWEPQPYDEKEIWYLKTDVGEDVLMLTGGAELTDNLPSAPLKEMCILNVASIVVTLEAGVGNKTLPMLMLHSGLKGSVHNWSSQMSVEAALTLQMGYYNSRLALWEPLIEPVEKENCTLDNLTHVPWEITFEMRMNNQDDQSDGPLSPVEGESTEEFPFLQPAMSIDITSRTNLEITLSKTCLEVLTNLGKAFSNAMQTGYVKHSEIVALYRVRNDCGLQITLLLDKGSFMLNQSEDPTTVVLESGADAHLQLKNDKSTSITELLNATLSSSNVHGADQFLHMKVDDANCELTLPVYRADKRYFSLNRRGDNNDMWGLISDISIEDGSLLVVLRSILKVYNHLKVPVEIYYMTSRGNELESISIIEPGASCDLPLKAIYTFTSELFFSVDGYSVTASPFIWKDLQLNLSFAKVLQCRPKNNINSTEPFIMKVVGEIEQVYHENTVRHTMSSTCYNIHLRPAVVLKNCLPIKITCMIQNSLDEKVIEPGSSLQLPNANPGKSSIVIRLPEYLEKEWSSKHEIPSTPSQFTVWQFDSYDSACKMTLDLGMHNENKNGTILLSLYCPSWMLNKTGLLLAYRASDENVNILHHPANFKGPILFSYNAKNFLGKKKASLRVDQGEWSDRFSLDVAGSAGVVVCKANDMIYQIGVSNELTYNGLTKQITFTPYYVIINNAHFAIECQEYERTGDPWTQVESNCCAPLWPKSKNDDKLIKLRVNGSTELTAPFLYTEMHTTLLKLKNKYGGINVDVQMNEGAVYIVLTSYLAGMAPALIVNHTPDAMKFWEKESVVIRTLEPNHSLLYTWENPAGPRLLVWDAGRKKELQDDLRKDGVGHFSPSDNYDVYWVSFLDGMQRVLLFTANKSIAHDAHSAGEFEAMQQEITLSIYGVGVSLVNNFNRQEIMYVAIAGSGVIWETCKLSSKRYKQMNVTDSALMEYAYQTYLATISTNGDLPRTVVVDNKTEVDFAEDMMIKPHKRRLRRTYLTGLWFQMKSSQYQLQMHAKIHRLQIDNQMFDCIFPVVLAPVPPPKSVAVNSELKPFAELSIVERLMKHSKIQQFKYYKVLIQEFHVKVDLGFVNALLELLQGSEQTEQEEVQHFVQDMELVNKPLFAHVSSQSVQEQKNFYDLLHFSPLKIHISFSMASGQSVGAGNGQSSTPPFLNVLLQGLGVTLTDLQDVVFRLAFFQREYSFLTQHQLVSEAKTHYVGQALKQLYVLVLGLDVIGNPYGLVVGLTKGVEDLFYEPFQGAIQGPGEFAEGLVLGVRSLFGHTVGGAAGAVSRITGAMGKGLAVLTFDKEYQRKRRDNFKKKPATIQEGIARSGKGLVMGVVDGVTGVFTKPISGAKEQGVEGFFKGLGKGAVGLVTRPTAGVIDFASGSLDFVKRAAEVGEETQRLRPPRFLPGDGMVRAYMGWEARGNKLLSELEKGKYANTDVYSFHVVVVEKKDVVLLTDKRIAYIVHSDIFGGWQIDWSYTWQELQFPAKVVPKGVAITTNESKKKVLGFFGNSDSGKIILIGNPDLKEKLCKKIEDLRKNA